MGMTIFYFLSGLGLLILGAEWLVRGSSRMARALGISPLIIGLTVVAFGTSSPEFAVSIQAATSGQGTVALGNILGSNIFNTLLILGLSAIITPLVVHQKLIRIDVPIMIGVSALIILLSWDGRISGIEGGLLFGGLIAYITFLIYQSRQEAVEVEQEYTEQFDSESLDLKGWSMNIGFTVGGLGLLVWGSNWLVESAVVIATFFGVSELIIGLTIVAAGTSLPEVVTSVIASLRGERDIAVANVIGSNLFNLLGVLGVLSMAAPNGVEVAAEVLRFDLPVLFIVSLVCLPIFFTGTIIGRWEGLLLLGYYGIYTAYLILTAKDHASLSLFNDLIMYVAMPITVVILGASLYRHFRHN